MLTIGIASWPDPDGPARIGLDPSFEGALGYAISHGLHFGTDIVYTYGPLGFLGFASPWFGPLSILAIAFVGVIHFATCAFVVVGARRVLSLWPTALVSYLACRETTAFLAYDQLLVLVFVASAGLLLARVEERPPSWVIPAGGAITAVGLLGKLNDGIFIAAIVAITVMAVFPSWRRSLLLFTAWACVSSILLWTVTGQGVTDLPAYVLSSYEVIGGFSQAMGLDGGASEYLMLLAFALGVLLIARVAAHETEGHAVVRRAGLALVGAVMAFAFFKTGFVRMHVEYALGAVVFGLFAVVRGRTARPVFLGVFVAVILPAIVARADVIGFAEPVDSASSFYDEAMTAFRPWVWIDEEALTRNELQAAYALEPGILEVLRGHTVAVDPWETAVLIARPDLIWRPVPVFQSYAAYTTTLDSLNAAALRGPTAPEGILRHTEVGSSGSSASYPPAIDGRNPWFDAPAAMLESFCRYDELAASLRWEVLGLTTRHCGSPESLGTVEVRTGEVVAVPVDIRPNRFVILRVHGVDNSLVDKVITTLYKSPEWSVTLNGTDTFRLVPGTAVDGLLMSVPLSIVRSPGFAFGIPVHDISIAPRMSSAGNETLTFEFLSVPLIGQ